MHTHSFPRLLRSRRGSTSISLVLAFGAALTAQSPAPEFSGLAQACQVGVPTPYASLDTPSASIATNVNFVVQVVNSQIAVYQRSSPHLVWRNYLGGVPMPGSGCPAPNLDSFFGGNPLGLGATRIVDTKVLHDYNLERFCVIGMQQNSEVVSGSPGLYVAWSNNDYPMPNTCGGGGWRTWRTPVPNLGNGIEYQPDFNGMGQTTTHVIWSGILQPVSQPASQPYTWYRYFRKSDLSANPQPHPLPYHDILVARPTSEFAHAADSFDANTPMYLVSALVNSNQLRLTTVNLGNHTEINTTLTVEPFIAASGRAPQSGGTFLDTIDGRIQSAVLRDGYLYCCHTVLFPDNLRSRHVVRWYQIALNSWPSAGGVPMVTQWGNVDLRFTTGDQPVHAFMPALTVDHAGTVMIAFARSAANEEPSLAFASRRSYDAPGEMPRRGILRTGDSPYTTSGLTNAGAYRWGDWSSVAVDPGRLGRFVLSGSVAERTGNVGCVPSTNHWETWITHVVTSTNDQMTHYGFGHPGTNGVPTIAAWPAPRLSSSPTVTVSNSLGANAFGMAQIGFFNAPNGIPSGFGGLFWVDQAVVTTIGFTLDSVSGSFPVPIPSSPGLIGLPVYLQGAVFDPGASHGVAFTDGLRVLIGA